MLQVDVCFSPALYPVYHHPETIVVVVDIFRATTTMVTAFERGVRSIRPVATVEEAEAYKQAGWLVGAERNVKRCPFADFGNSPFDYTADKVAGKDIVFTTTNGTRAIMAQRYIPEIVEGDKRVLLINGHVVPYALARIPQHGEVRGNLAAGGVGRAQPLTPGDRKIAEALAPVLAKQGHFLVGLDIIGEWLTEINVTSPTCFREITQQTGFNVAGLFMDELEKAV